MHSEGLIIQVQLALIGIILVIGLFFLWRAVGRIEEKLDKVLIAVNTPQVCKREPVSDFQDENAFAEKLMNDVFAAQQGGGAAGFVFVNPITETDAQVQGEGLVEITEEESEVVVNDNISIGGVVPEVLEQKDEEDTESESTNPLSKTKLNKMNVAELQELCRQRGLNVEGAKKVLVDRLLGLTRD